MLPKHVWRQYEPHFEFPLFKRARSTLSFAISPDFNPRNYKKYKSMAKALVVQRMPSIPTFLYEQATLFLSLRPERVRFRLVFITWAGKFLGSRELPGDYLPGGYMNIDVSAVVSDLGLPEEDHMVIVVMSRGRLDGFRAAPGNFWMTYVSAKHCASFRIGAFARTLNDPRRKSHHGFRGIYPAIILEQGGTSGIILNNHSSCPAYDASVRPKAQLVRADGVVRETDFGVIPAFGARERSIPDLFGDDVAEFLSPFDNTGVLIVTCPGVTLAGLFVLRDSTGELMAIDHSRPSHAYLSGVRTIRE